MIIRSLALFFFTVSAQFAHATIIFDESIDGDLPDTRISGLSRLPFVLGPSTDDVLTIFGTAVLGDGDDFFVSVEPSSVVRRIIGSFSATYDGTSGSGFYNSTGVPSIGSDRADGIFQGFITPGVTESVEFVPFTAGGLRIQVNDTNSDGLVHYRFDFRAVPEPSIIALVGLGLVGFCVARRKVV